MVYLRTHWSRSRLNPVWQVERGRGGKRRDLLKGRDCGSAVSSLVRREAEGVILVLLAKVLMVRVPRYSEAPLFSGASLHCLFPHGVVELLWWV